MEIITNKTTSVEISVTIFSQVWSFLYFSALHCALPAFLYIEYEKASNELGETCTDQAWEQMERRPSPYFDVISEVLGDLPMVRIFSFVLGIALKKHVDLLCYQRDHEPFPVLHRVYCRPTTVLFNVAILHASYPLHYQIV